MSHNGISLAKVEDMINGVSIDFSLSSGERQPGVDLEGNLFRQLQFFYHPQARLPLIFLQIKGPIQPEGNSLFFQQARCSSPLPTL